MLVVETIAKIRRALFEQGKPIKAIRPGFPLRATQGKDIKDHSKLPR